MPNLSEFRLPTRNLSLIRGELPSYFKIVKSFKCYSLQNMNFFLIDFIKQEDLTIVYFATTFVKL